VNGLATYLGVTTAPASRAVSALVAKGLVTSEPHPDDRRSQIFTLTPAGREALAHDPIQRLARAVARLPEEEKRRLVRLLDALRRELDAKGAPEPGSAG
jgi:DNA-binding MarR family transcriptional regulator